MSVSRLFVSVNFLPCRCCSDDVVLNIFLWCCWIDEVDMEIVFRHCYNNIVTLKFLLWCCSNDVALQLTLWRCSFHDVALKFRQWTSSLWTWCISVVVIVTSLKSFTFMLLLSWCCLYSIVCFENTAIKIICCLSFENKTLMMLLWIFCYEVDALMMFCRWLCFEADELILSHQILLGWYCTRHCIQLVHLCCCFDDVTKTPTCCSEGVRPALKLRPIHVDWGHYLELFRFHVVAFFSLAVAAMMILMLRMSFYVVTMIS
jgi:hypothetical protein